MAQGVQRRSVVTVGWAETKVPGWQVVVVKQNAWPASGWKLEGVGHGWQLRSEVSVGAANWYWPARQVCQVRHTVLVEPAQAAKRKLPAEQLLQGTQRLGLRAV